MIECNGPSGFYTHLFRFAVMGKAPQAIVDAHKLVLAAEQNVLDRMKPGVSCAEVFAAHNVFMRAHGLPEEKRILAAGYKKKTQNGQTFYCRKETPIGSRFESERCETAEEMAMRAQQGKDFIKSTTAVAGSRN